MAIKATDTNRNLVTLKHEGRVCAVRTFLGHRNMSDTLDYTDYRDVRCTEALVYVGRVGDGSHWDRVLGAPILNRFEWVDCSNHFTWRGADVLEAEVDEVMGNAELVEDWMAHQARMEAEAQKRAEELAKREAAIAAESAEREKNRPVKGKLMQVKRKCKGAEAGHVGVVAVILHNGRCLLKAQHEWQNRQANGVWVNSNNLRAV